MIGRRRRRPDSRRALWVGMEDDLAAYVAEKGRPRPTPEDIARAAWEQYHHAADRLPRWWHDPAERERRFQVEKAVYLPQGVA
jgi:hypothetical protein